MDSSSNLTDLGVVSIKIPSSVMKGVGSGRYVYDLQWVLPPAPAAEDQTPNHTTILTGSFVVNEDVTEYVESEGKTGKK